MTMQRKVKTFEDRLPARPRKEWDTIEQHVEYLRHFAAYKHVKKFVEGKSVLEVGCGAGYGANYLSKFGSNAVAIDISKGHVAYCHINYKKEKLAFLHASGLGIPLKDSSIDVAVSFQVIEHIEPKKVARFLSEIKRTLKDGGDLFVSTPNKKLRLLPFQKPEARNPDHKKEYTSKELEKLFGDFFEEVKVYGLKGSPEIQSLVLNQLRQNPSDIYRVLVRRITNLLTPLIKKSLPSVRRRKSEVKKNHQNTQNLRIDGFKIVLHCAKDSLDFTVHAKKTI